jgi:hypothetical protein
MQLGRFVRLKTLAFVALATPAGAQNSDVDFASSGDRSAASVSPFATQPFDIIPLS